MRKDCFHIQFLVLILFSLSESIENSKFALQDYVLLASILEIIWHLKVEHLV